MEARCRIDTRDVMPEYPEHLQAKAGGEGVGKDPTSPVSPTALAGLRLFDHRETGV
jgi:hypothetical protein